MQSKQVGRVVHAAVTIFLCAAVARAQDTGLASIGPSTPPGLHNPTIDKNIQVPKCLRRGTPVESVRTSGRSIGRGFMTQLLLLTTCSLGIEINPFNAMRETRSDAADAGGPGVASSFEQLEVLVRPGNTVTVIDTSGSRISGRIERLSSANLSLAVDGTRRDFGEMDVRVVRHRRADSLGHGAWWGFSVGAGLALLAIASCGECWDQPGYAISSIGSLGAMGAGFGVGIDALVRSEQTIYQRRGASLSFRF